MRTHLLSYAPLLWLASMHLLSYALPLWLASMRTLSCVRACVATPAKLHPLPLRLASMHLLSYALSLWLASMHPLPLCLRTCFCG